MRWQAKRSIILRSYPMLTNMWLIAVFMLSWTWFLYQESATVSFQTKWKRPGLLLCGNYSFHKLYYRYFWFDVTWFRKSTFVSFRKNSEGKTDSFDLKNRHLIYMYKSKNTLYEFSIIFPYNFSYESWESSNSLSNLSQNSNTKPCFFLSHHSWISLLNTCWYKHKPRNIQHVTYSL